MPKIPPLRQQIIVNLYNGGLSVPMIAQRYPISAGRIYRLLQRKNVPIHYRGFRKKSLSFRLSQSFSEAQMPLVAAASMFYLLQGAKRGSTVEIGNSRPVILKLFLKFLREICRVDEQKLRFYLYCSKDQNVENLKGFWSRYLKAPIVQFAKPSFRPVSKQWGVLHIRYNDKRLLEKILSLCSSIVARLA